LVGVGGHGCSNEVGGGSPDDAGADPPAWRRWTAVVGTVGQAWAKPVTRRPMRPRPGGGGPGGPGGNGGDPGGGGNPGGPCSTWVIARTSQALTEIDSAAAARSTASFRPSGNRSVRRAMSPVSSTGGAFAPAAGGGAAGAGMPRLVTTNCASRPRRRTSTLV